MVGLLLSITSAIAETPSVLSGTAFAVTSEGHLLTNAHVVGSNSNEVVVRDKKGNLYKAKILSLDPTNDLALLQIPATTKPLPIRTLPAQKGEAVFTLGFPHIDVQGVESKLTEGIVSAWTGIRGDPRFFQISVPVQSGNSGGPLLDLNGSVVGIVTAKLDAKSVLSTTGDLTQNVNYALKVSYAGGLTDSLSGLSRARTGGVGKVLSPSLVTSIESSVYLVLTVAETQPKTEQPKPRQERKPATDVNVEASVSLDVGEKSDCLEVRSIRASDEFRSTLHSGNCITHCAIRAYSAGFPYPNEYQRVFDVDDLNRLCMDRFLAAPRVWFVSFKLIFGEFRTITNRRSSIAKRPETKK
jgi:hypothetical protein